ncbi:UDP-3-O-(3-hydroxymyristoyl)glucosamine N-acyltransferase [bacterium]|nr:UDP-3-O-(3-hydroxymyristoyl)glucosamine N-acyltransferase [bacterium]
MKLKNPIKLASIAQQIGAEVIGDENATVTGINEIHKVEAGDLTFVNVEKYYKKALNSAATFVIINKKVEAPAGKSLLLHHDPFDAYNRLVAAYYPVHNAFSKTETISAETNIHPEATIYPHVVIGNHVSVGKGSIIFPNVVLYDNVHIGQNVIIHSGSIIGGQAFYYGKKNGEYIKWHSCGSVQIEDEVEIGSGCTIDKGVSGDTVIGRGTKLDNQVHVGHGVVIGKNCLFAAQCGIGGKTIIEDEVVCWGQVGITKDVRIGKGAVLSAQCGVSKSLPGGKAYYGSPARELKVVQKEMAALRNLPDFLKNKHM